MTNDNQTVLSEENKTGEAVKRESPEDLKAAIQSNSEVPDKTEPTAPEFNPQQSYESLRKEYESTNKNYSELRKEFTRRSQSEAELKKKLDLMYETLSKATEQPIDPAAFMRDLQSQGPKALEPLLGKFIDPVKAGYQEELQKRDAAAQEKEISTEIKFRRLDKETYPNFKELEPIMNQIAESDNSPINWNMPVAECLDVLYKLAKDRSSEQAVTEAVKIGEKKAEERLAKESRSTVAGGSKSVSTSATDLNSIKSIDKLREVVASMHGVADRD